MTWSDIKSEDIYTINNSESGDTNEPYFYNFLQEATTHKLFVEGCYFSLNAVKDVKCTQVEFTLDNEGGSHIPLTA